MAMINATRQYIFFFQASMHRERASHHLFKLHSLDAKRNSLECRKSLVSFERVLLDREVRARGKFTTIHSNWIWSQKLFFRFFFVNLLSAYNRALSWPSPTASLLYHYDRQTFIFITINNRILAWKKIKLITSFKQWQSVDIETEKR